ncbi:LacI family DNA-binding transcriptional regulator [Streptomyces sp. LN500]|uniref:LacI family DNA-binding transcriptional regulator n=1 Tax=Streptomyces sp. LN500 TaxID=3112978 RepID=UPI00371F80F4
MTSASQPAPARPTSRDVARAAGVSQATVSLVLGDKWRGRVSEATAERVRSATQDLGYRPNLAARSLRLGRTRTALLVVPALTNEFFARVYTGAAAVAAEHGFGVVLYPSPDGTGPPGTPSPPPAPHSTESSPPRWPPTHSVPCTAPTCPWSCWTATPRTRASRPASTSTSPTACGR